MARLKEHHVALKCVSVLQKKYNWVGSQGDGLGVVTLKSRSGLETWCNFSLAWIHVIWIQIQTTACKIYQQLLVKKQNTKYPCIK